MYAFQEEFVPLPPPSVVPEDWGLIPFPTNENGSASVEQRKGKEEDGENSEG